MICCIRGAITADTNTRGDILSATRDMLEDIMTSNSLKAEDITAVLFTATRDLDAVYPAVAARELGIVDASLMCVQEMYVEGSLKMCIRASVTVDIDKKQSEVNHSYLKGAMVLRPDLVKKVEAVAIDGPAGSGKSTVAKALAAELGYIYVDTGAMYRTVGLYCLNNGIDVSDNEAVEAVLGDIDIKLKHSNAQQEIYLNGENVTGSIRTQEVADAASKVAAIPAVRKLLVRLQQSIVKSNRVVMDGRDIGTNVIPNARVKVYLSATVEERARRRCKELAEKGLDFDEVIVREEISQRDDFDKSREVNPLTVAKDAVVIDSSALSIEQTKAAIMALVRGE
jgi:cytidylate kinase